MPPMTNEQFALKYGQMSMLETDGNQFYSVGEYARAMGVHRHTVLNWIHADKVQYIAIPAGSYVRYYIPSRQLPRRKYNRKV